MMQCHDCDTRPPTSTTPLALQHGAFYCLDGTLGALDGLLSHCNHFRLADPGSAYLSFPLSGVDFVYFSTPAHAVTQACQIKVRTVSDSDKSTRKFVTEPWGTLGKKAVMSHPHTPSLTLYDLRACLSWGLSDKGQNGVRF